MGDAGAGVGPQEPVPICDNACSTIKEWYMTNGFSDKRMQLHRASTSGGFHLRVEERALPPLTEELEGSSPLWQSPVVADLCTCDAEAAHKVVVEVAAVQLQYGYFCCDSEAEPPGCGFSLDCGLPSPPFGLDLRPPSPCCDPGALPPPALQLLHAPHPCGVHGSPQAACSPRHHPASPLAGSPNSHRASLPPFFMPPGHLLQPHGGGSGTPPLPQPYGSPGCPDSQWQPSGGQPAHLLDACWPDVHAPAGEAALDSSAMCSSAWDAAEVDCAEMMMCTSLVFGQERTGSARCGEGSGGSGTAGELAAPAGDVTGGEAGRETSGGAAAGPPLEHSADGSLVSGGGAGDGRGATRRRGQGAARLASGGGSLGRVERKPSVSMQQLAEHFHLPITAAAKQLEICPTVLKKVCRRNGLKRWPHRQLKSIDKLLARLKLSAAAEAEAAASAAEAGQLDASAGHRQQLQQQIDQLLRERSLICFNASGGASGGE